MRILHIVRQFAPAVGGFENYVANLAREQHLAGHRVTVLTINRVFSDPARTLPRTEQLPYCKVIRIPYYGSYKYPIAPSFLKHLSDCDLIHVHAIDFFFDAASWTRTWHWKPLVVSTHGGFFHTPYRHRAKQLFFMTVTRLSLRAYRAILASSVNDQQLFSKITRRRIDLVENGVDTEKFRGCGGPSLRKAIAHIGRFASHKRFDHLLDFLQHLRALDEEWTLTIIGGEWDLKAEDLRRLARDRNVEGAVRILLGLSDDEIREELRHCSFVASASDYEGFGIAVIEGMSAGLWPILNDIVGFRRVHERSGIGLVCTFANPSALAQRFLAAVGELTHNYEEARTKAMAFAAGYAWSGVAKQIEAIYDRALGRRQRTIFRVPVTVATSDQAIDQIDSDLDAGRDLAVAFFNAHAANLAARDEAFCDCLHRFRVLNDGIGIDLASLWLYGKRFPENLNGTDFVLEYLRRTRRVHRIYLLGARPEVVALAARRFAALLPRHQIAGWHHGYFPASERDGIVESIRLSGASVLLVALGNPKQELWIDEHFRDTGCRLAFGVGALFDFVAGAVPRAPRWMRATKIEWLYRLALEPRRLWRRYLIGNVTFLARVIGRGMEYV